ncbi:MAG: [Fe-Fe] hydrogenase large subunit C-terminal domain-containing protein [Lachnoclostridium sp.]|nr:[Fe-Fe] hydrogenase large subunit C-terminal domain-containing protein [Lachnoclostridium sp.]
MDILIVAARLLLAAFLGAIIGIEREIKKRAAGFRTHIIVSVGACLIMLIGIDGFEELYGKSWDASRLAGQVISGIKHLGFYNVVEAALGADIVADAESRELVKEGFLTSSCCPAFVSYIEKNFPNLSPHISTNVSPMVAISRYIKQLDETAKIVFIGPCTAKKAEIQLDKAKKYVDVAMTFEELQSLFDSRDIEIAELDEEELDNASYFGRIFARCGGLAEAVAEGIKEHGDTEFELKAVSCDGIEECKIALLKKSKGVLDANFIEGMACVGGCVGGAGCLTHGPRNKIQVDKHGKEAIDRTISETIKDAADSIL